MTLSIPPKNKSKDGPKKAPRRRVTVDLPSFTRPTRPLPKRRLSLEVKKTVQFSEMSEVCVFDAPSPTKIWYTGRSYERFKQERLADVMSFREFSKAKPATPSFGSCCPVGLEQLLSSKGIAEAHSNRRIVIRSVLIEQQRQQAVGCNDPNQIALLSVKLSEEAFKGAQKRGKFQELAKFME